MRIWNIGLIIIFLIFVTISNLQAQRLNKLGPFDGLIVTGNIDLVLVQGESESIEISTRKIPESEVNVGIRNGVLKVSILNSVFHSEAEAEIVLTYKQLREIKATAGAEVMSEAPLNGDKIEIKAGSGAEIELQVSFNALEATASEGGQLVLSGKVSRQYAKVYTGGSYDGIDLECQDAYVKANTGGQVAIVAYQSLDATANTGGIIEYIGQPEELYTKTVLAGEIRKIKNHSKAF